VCVRVRVCVCTGGAGYICVLIQLYILQEERNYIADLCKKIAKTGANVILLQKSILRDAITDLGLHFLAKLKVLLTSTTVLAY
jgi:chaperonin GroEL (HSP60 family)